jgi:hypothetical protein
MVSAWLWYGVGVCLERFSFDFDMVIIWIWYGSGTVLKLLHHRHNMVLVWFWYGLWHCGFGYAELV